MPRVKKAHETLAEGFFPGLEEVRARNPSVWFKGSRISPDLSSPWMALWMNTVAGPWWSDSPTGFVPAPVYREAKITGRDQAWIQANKASHVLPPARAVQALEPIHQDSDPGFNTMMIAVMRGGMLIPHYLNPNYLRADEWKFLAHLMKWTRDHEQALSHSKVFGGEPLKREVYGIAHVANDEELVYLHNPFITRMKFSLQLDRDVGLPETEGRWSVRTVYPYRKGVAASARHSETVDFALEGYETLVLECVPHSRLEEPMALDARYRIAEGSGGQSLELLRDSRSPGRVEVLYPGGASQTVKPAVPAPADAIVDEVEVTPVSGVTGSLMLLVHGETTETTPLSNPQAAKVVTNRFTLEVPKEGEAKLCFLLEVDEMPPDPGACSLTVDGTPVHRTGASPDSDFGGWGVADQDVTDALTTAEEEREALAEPALRFVGQQDGEFQRYPSIYYYHNHWLWALADIGPGRHEVVFSARFPPVPTVWLGGPRYGSWLGLKRRLAAQTLPLASRVAAGEAPPELFLPEKDLETSYTVITPYQRV